MSSQRTNFLSTVGIPFLVSLVIFFVFYHIVSHNALMVHSVTVSIISDHDAEVKLYYDDTSPHPVFTERSVASQYLPAGKQTDLHFRIATQSLTGLRIDPGNGVGKSSIFQIELHQLLGRHKVLGAKEIYSLFSSDLNHNVSLIYKIDSVEILAIGDDPYLVSAGTSVGGYLPVYMGIPIIILTFYLCRLLMAIPPEILLSYVLPRRSLPSKNALVLHSLDGLRGFAALLVVAAHTLPHSIGTGRSGVLIFFALSGFLLTKPFVRQPQRICEIAYMVRYGGQRLKRILPMYYFYLFIVYGMNLRINEFTLHAFFLEGKGHLWTIPQEMLFYTVFPALPFIHHKIFKSRIVVMVLFLLPLFYVGCQLMDVERVYLFGMNDEKLPLLLPFFLLGSFFSYIYFGFLEDYLNSSSRSNVLNGALSVVSIFILLIFVFFSNGKLIGSSLVYSTRYQLWYGLCAALVIILVSCIRDNMLTRLLSSRLLTSIGVVSYSLYLLHPLVIDLERLSGFTGISFFFAVLFVSYLFSCCTYHLVEKPFFTKKS